jgi:hypothetical protein
MTLLPAPPTQAQAAAKPAVASQKAAPEQPQPVAKAHISDRTEVFPQLDHRPYISTRNVPCTAVGCGCGRSAVGAAAGAKSAVSTNTL